MRKKLGVLCVVLGLCCLLSSMGLIIYNRRAEQKAENASKVLLQDMQEQLTDVSGGEKEQSEELQQEMATAQVDGYDCIGVLSIPVLELKLPVLTDWSYEKLRIAPCHYFGSYYGTDFVIAAHNYQSHFGRLSALQPKDLVLFTDISGTVYCYEVVLLETLPANATEEMITSGFDLSLYTCTPGGSNRVTVRCKAVEK